MVKHIQVKLFKLEFAKLPAKPNENIQAAKLGNCSMQQPMKSKLYSLAISKLFLLFKKEV